MSTLKADGAEVTSIFQLIGNKENDITKSIAWALLKCPVLLKKVICYLFDEDIDVSDVQLIYQSYDSDTGITDLEITDDNRFYLIIEAKRGWILPGTDQLTKYSLREDFLKNSAAKKMIVSMSECTEEYAKYNLPFEEVNGIQLKHLSWKKIYDLAGDSRYDSNNEQKDKNSNWVYVVALGSGNPEGCSISWRDIVNVKGKYFHPVGGNGWPKNPPNYIAFRYNGMLQSIHYIEDYVVTNNLHTEVSEMPDKDDVNHFVYKLGPAIVPSKEVRTGNIYRNGRVWAMFDTLLTADTIAEARDISKDR